MNINNIVVKVALPSGNRALYEVAPAHATLPIELGTQLAHEKDDTWYCPGGWVPMNEEDLLRLENLASPAPRSWKPVFQTAGNGDSWSSNALRFATKEEALANARDLAGRWFLVTAVDAHESDDPVNYRWVDGKLVEVSA